MKRIRIYVVAIMTLMAGFTSCSEDFLKIDHYDVVTPDILMTSQAFIEQGLNGIYDLFYPEKYDGASDLQNNWNLKPHIGFCNYPALDLQATGWDIPLNTHEWKPDFYMFGDTWKRCYNVIDRCNRFLANLEKFDVNLLDDGETTKKIIEAEARAIRAYYYTFMCQSWGGVPMLLTGDTYSNMPNKERGTKEEAWNIIIEDLEFARDNLSLEPWKGNVGRVTKGMAKAYLGLAYMYNNRFADAKRELKDVIDCGKYELNPCFYFIHTPGQVWQKESVWEVAFPTWSYMGWGAESSSDAVLWWGPMLSSHDFDGWGPACVSYEFGWSFEPGDRRLEYSVAQLGELHPSFEQELGKPGSAQTGAQDWTKEPFVSGDVVPANYMIKFWKAFAYDPYSAMSITFMRLAGVMLNYAECCFETGDNAEGWKYINLIRERAWGKLEPNAVQPFDDFLKRPLNNDPNITVPDAETYYSTYKRTGGTVGGEVNVWKSWMKSKVPLKDADGNVITPITYPDSTFTTGWKDGLKAGIFEKEQITMPYQYKPYTIPAWKVALIMERRHEFLGEYSFWQDLCRMGVVGEYMDAEYPKNDIKQSVGTEENPIYNIHTYRPLDFFDYQMLYPIPTLEMETNKALKTEDQNPGYY